MSIIIVIIIDFTAINIVGNYNKLLAWTIKK
jgi:hypothetical protein